MAHAGCFLCRGRHRPGDELLFAEVAYGETMEEEECEEGFSLDLNSSLPEPVCESLSCLVGACISAPLLTQRFLAPATLARGFESLP